MIDEEIEIIRAWLKEAKLSDHYEVDRYMIECKFYHSWGVNRIRIVEQAVYYWAYSRNGFNKVVLEMADPAFFEKLSTVLTNHCANRKKKVYRQL